MDKRTLKTIPRPELTEENKKMLLLAPNMSYLVTSQRIIVSGEDTLILNFFARKKGELKPAFRTFCQSTDYVSQDLTVECTKWKTGAIGYLTGYMYWYKNKGNIVVASIEDRNCMMQFLYEFKEKHQCKDIKRYMPESYSTVDMEIADRIDEYQNQIKEWKLKEKHDKEKTAIDKQMNKFPDIPSDYDRFVRETVFSDNHYIFYSSKEMSAYCTSCELDYELDKDKHLRHSKIPIWNDRDKVKHNSDVCCPYCGKFIQCKSEGMSRQSLFAIQWSVLVQKNNEDVLIRYFCHTKDFRKNYRNPIFTTKELFRTVHTAEKSHDYEWGRFKSTYEYRWCEYQEHRYTGYMTPAENVYPRSAVLYNENISEAISGTCMKYSAVDIYLNEIVKSSTVFNRPWTLDWYFNCYRKYPYLEQLLKVGFYRLAKDVMEEERYRCFEHGRTILETLGIDKISFNMLRELKDPSARDVMILRYARGLSQKEFDILRYVHDYGYSKMYEKYLDMREYTTIHKVKRYLGKMGINHQTDYFDYIRWIGEMGYDMHNEFNLFPKDFKRSHDEVSKEYIKFQDKKSKEEIKRFNKVLKKMQKDTLDAEPMKLKAEGLFIRMPGNLDELKKEGEALHHCVGSYRDRVAKGETMIFFIRKEEKPEKPFFTLEWKGKVVQCRGFHNCEMTPEVKAFVRVFQNKMVKYENEPKKTRKAG